MKIFIVAHSSRTGGGISVAQNLLLGFANIAPHHHYFVTIPPGLGYEKIVENHSAFTLYQYKTQGYLSRWYWETYQLPKIIKQFQPDIVFNTANRCVMNLSCPQTVHIRDPHLVYPESQFGPISLKERLLFRYHKNHLKKSLGATNLVFCQTPVMEKRFKEVFGTQVPTAICSKQFSPFAKPEGVPSCPERLKPYHDKLKLFVLTHYYTHKNLEIIVDVFKKYQDKLRDVVVILTISEEQHPGAKRLLAMIKQLRLENNIITVGSLRQQELAAYYRNCHALFLPTLLESFSGTYLEAMNFQTPILTSDMDFAHNICGDAAIYFDPIDVDSVYNAIIKFKDAPDIARQLVEAGHDQMKRFDTSWNDIAQGVMKELEGIVQKSKAL